MSKRKAIRHFIVAALVILSAAICALAQDGRAGKQNAREQVTKASVSHSETVEPVTYSYEFKKAEFLIRRVLIQHDANGKGSVTFERQGDLEPLVEPLELSDSARERIIGLWSAMRFLDSNTDYQADRQYPHLGTMWLRMTNGTRAREAEFNWTNDANAKALALEYRHVANQIIIIFDIGVSRENQPLNSPKLLDLLDRYITSKELSDPQQLIPLLRELSTDERIPLMSRNKAGRILKRLEK